MIGTNDAFAVEPVEAGRDLAKNVHVEVQRPHHGSRLEPPHHRKTQPARRGERPDGLRASPKPLQDIADFCVQAGHEATIVHICEQRKPSVRNDVAMFTIVNGYAPAMSLAELISLRAERVIAVRGLSQERWRVAAGISTGTMHGFVSVRHNDAGQVTPSLVTVEKACAAVGIPIWAFLHPDSAMLELFLSDRAGELVESERAGGAAAAVMSCMAVLAEIREVTEDAEQVKTG